MKRFTFPLTALFAALVLAGCASSTPPKTVAMDVPAQYKEAAPLDGAWKVAQPSDQADRGQWWTIYNDAQLNDLIEQSAKSSPTLAIALARVKESRATAGLADADRAFQLGAGIGPTRQGVQGQASTQWRAQFNASYEVDMFGRLSGASRAAKLDAEGQEAAYRSVLLALQADVAQSYFAIRSLDAELDVLQQTVVLRQDALRLLQRRYDLGDTSELDVAQASTELATTQAEQESVQRNRDQFDHALAVLLGKAPSQFSLPSQPIQAVNVTVPPGLPSDLLERRPDIARAQRDVAAAAERVGVAKAAFFPSLVLTGTGGYASSTLGELFNWSSRTFLLGPARPFDVVFLDPPFAAGLLPDLCKLLEQRGWLAPRAYVYLENAVSDAAVPLPDGWEAVRETRAGEVRAVLVQRRDAGSPATGSERTDGR